jgi:hypothetical protein
MAADGTLRQGETVWLAEASMAAGGQTNIPISARRHLGIEGVATRLLVFGQSGRIVLTPVPLADELLEFAAERAAEIEADAS